MANYQRCNIRVYPNSGPANLDTLRGQVEQLMVENNIYEAIEVYYPPGLKFGEIRFTAKRYPTMLNAIFAPEEYDLWAIIADEGGGSDLIRFETRNRNPFWGFYEKAIYNFDEIRLTGEPKVILAKAEEVFGFGIRWVDKHEMEDGVKIYINGLYSGCNFFYNNEESDIIIAPVEKEPHGKLRNGNGEFWDMLFHADGIRFMENFYRPVQKAVSGVNLFPFLERIEFYNKKRLSNIIEWTNLNGMRYWRHASGDGFWNCGNARFYAYDLLNK